MGVKNNSDLNVGAGAKSKNRNKNKELAMDGDQMCIVGAIFGYVFLVVLGERWG